MSHSDPFNYPDADDLEQPTDTLEHVRVRNDHMPDEVRLCTSCRTLLAESGAARRAASLGVRLEAPISHSQ